MSNAHRKLPIVAALLLATGVGACARFDPSGIPIDVPDADNCSHGECLPTLTLPEGGEFRIELFQIGYDPETGEHEEKLGAWFFAFTGQQNTAAQEPLAPRALLGPELADVPGCHDHLAGDFYLNGASAENQAIVDTRTYFDVGATTTTTGWNSEFVMVKQLNTQDPSQLLQHKVVYLADENRAHELERGAKYWLDPIPEGNGFPGLELRNGVSVPNAVISGQPEWNDTSLYMPPNFELISPTEAQYFGENHEGLTINVNEDLAIAWTVPEVPAGWVASLQFTGFLTYEGRFQYLCVGPHKNPAANEDTYRMTIKKELFSKPNFPVNGKLIHGTITHNVWNLEAHRFEVVGVNCKFSRYQLVEPAEE